MKIIQILSARFAIALSLGLVVLVVLDARNPVMGFLTSDTAKIYILITCLVSVIAGIMLLVGAQRTSRPGRHDQKAPEESK